MRRIKGLTVLRENRTSQGPSKGEIYFPFDYQGASELLSIKLIFPTPNMEDNDKNIEIYKVSRRALQKRKCLWEYQC